MPTYYVNDHLGRLLTIYRDLKTNEGARKRAWRNFSTATTIARYDLCPMSGELQHTYTFNLVCNL